MRQIEHHEHVPSRHHGKHVEVALADLRDPLNVGQAFRICTSLGVRHLHLCGATPTPPLAKINRTARGAQHAVPWSSKPAHETLETFRASGGKVIGIEYATASVDLRELSFVEQQPLLLVLGNEAHGIARDLLDSCDVVAHLPLYGPISSLNVATALALSVWEVVR